MLGPQKANAILERLYAEAAGQGPVVSRTPAGLHVLSGAATALSEAGVMDASTHEAWQTRIRELAARLMASDTERVERLLTRAVETAHALRDDPQHQDDGAHTVLGSRCHGMIEALAEAGILSADEQARWRERLAGPSGPTDAVPTFEGTAGLPSDAVPADLLVDWSPEPLPGWSLPAPFSGRHLRRGLALDAEEVDGTRPVSLELHDDGVVVVYLRAGPPPRTLDELRSAASLHPDALRLHDDADTAYRNAGSNGGSHGEVMRYTQIFVPAVPTHATELRVTVDTLTWRIRLPE